MKKYSTFLCMLMLLVCGVLTANAQSKVPGTLDLSTAVVDAGTGTLHDGAGWDGSKIDWMTKGNTATIPFENTKNGAKFKIISYGGTNQSQVVVGFSILDSKGNLVYDQTTEPYASGGFGDKKKNASLPITDALPAGNYTLDLYYDNLEEGATLEVNISQIDFIDADEYSEDPVPGAASLNIPGVLDGTKAVITKNCTWGSTPSCDDSNNFNWVGDGDIVTFAITNTKTSAYAISFDTATPCEPVTIDFLITDANGQTVYGQTANVVCTGENGGDWAFKPEGHNTSLPVTDVLAAGNYTLALTFHQGTNYENFTTNLKDITFTAVGGGNEIEIDMPSFGFVTNQNNTGNWNGEKLDYFQFGDVISIPFSVTAAGDYNVEVSYATIMSELQSTYSIETANGQLVWSEVIGFPYTTPEEGVNDWNQVKTVNATTNASLAPGNYNLVIAYDHRGLWQGNDGLNFQYNIHGLKLVGVGGGSTPAEAPNVFLHGANFDKANSTNDLYQFTDADGFTLTMNGRDINKTPCDWTDPNGVAFTDGINFKNNDPGTINVPAGKKIYALEIGGASQSDAGNLCYLYTVDVDGKNIFTEGIGQGITDNGVIQGSAKYPILPDGNAPRFALIDLTAAPAAESVKVVFSGNNQEDVWFKLYTTEADANVVLGKGGQPVETKVLYTWEGAADGALEVGGKAVASDGESVNYANSGNYTIRVNKNKANIETDYVEITFDEALQEGDEIAITGYRNKDTDANGTLYILFDNGAAIDEGDEVKWNNIHADYAQEPNTNTYTVTDGAGSKSIKIARSKTGTNVFITKIVITRGGTQPDSDTRIWDFTKWSDATVANLKADAAATKISGWSDVEKQADADADKEPTDISKDNCFWFAGQPNEDGTLSANGVVIEELKGLVFHSSGTEARSLAIAVNYPETSLGAYAGPSYLWLGASNKDYFTIPAVKAGQYITIEAESHKPTDARGVRLMVNGEMIGIEFKPTTKEAHTWVVEADADVLVQNTNGCHLYTITVSSEEPVFTAVQTVKSAIASDVIYNLAGMRVDQSYKGVVIKNGKKYLQK